MKYGFIVIIVFLTCLIIGEEFIPGWDGNLFSEILTAVESLALGTLALLSYKSKQ